MGGNTALDGCLSADIHKDRSLDSTAMGAGKLSTPGTALGFNDFKHRVLLQKFSLLL
jgi:hypothetical protein